LLPHEDDDKKEKGEKHDRNTKEILPVRPIFSGRSLDELRRDCRRRRVETGFLVSRGATRTGCGGIVIVGTEKDLVQGPNEVSQVNVG
jgi:hypothetical protein